MKSYDDYEEAPSRIELDVVGCPDCNEQHFLLTFGRNALGWLSGGELGLQLSRDEVAALYQELAANLDTFSEVDDEVINPDNLPPTTPEHLRGLF